MMVDIKVDCWEIKWVWNGDCFMVDMVKLIWLNWNDVICVKMYCDEKYDLCDLWVWYTKLYYGKDEPGGYVCDIYIYGEMSRAVTTCDGLTL